MASVKTTASEVRDLKEIGELYKFLLNFRVTENEDDLLKEYYEDHYITEEQAKRDEQVTLLLEQYVKAYKNKVAVSRICRWLILVPCLLAVIGFSVALVCLIFSYATAEAPIELAGVAAFVTACVSFASLIIGLLTIITKYFFPENDEQYITQIVESIQKNDLENKRENAKNPADEGNKPVG